MSNTRFTTANPDCLHTGCGGVLCPDLLVAVPQLPHGLAEVHVHPAVVDEHIVHLEVRRLARLLVLKLDEAVAEAVARLEVADDVSGHDLAEAGEDDLEVVLLE